MLDITIGGGDPVFGTPVFTLEKQDVSGAFVPVPDLNNPARWIDSTNLETVVVFRPDPPTTKEILAERDHDWQFMWQVPPTLPTGTYRIHAKGKALTSTTGEWEAVTRTFSVVPSPNVIATATRVADQLQIRLEHPAEPLVKTPQDAYPLRGWSVFDMVGATQNIRTQTPLRVIFDLDGVPQPDVLTSTWNDAEGRHEVDTSGVSFNLDGGTLYANISLPGDDEDGVVRVLVQ
ncbi:MAG: hypothetical protein R3E66_05525 [bacterium]